MGSRLRGESEATSRMWAVGQIKRKEFKAISITWYS
jgi:hypothetical protein